MNLTKRRLKIYIIHKYHHHAEFISMKKKTSNLCVYCNTHCNSLRKYGMEMCETFINAVHKFSHSDFSFCVIDFLLFELLSSERWKYLTLLLWRKKREENWQFGVKWAAGDVKKVSLKRLHDTKQFPSTSSCVWFVIFCLIDFHCLKLFLHYSFLTVLMSDFCLLHIALKCRTQ